MYLFEKLHSGYNKLILFQYHIFCNFCFFFQIFNNVIETSTKSRNIETRLQILYEEITLSIYLNVSRGLFEKHKLVLSFMFNLAIRMNDKTITLSQWNFILRGPGKIETVNYKYLLFKKILIKFIETVN